MLNCKIDVWRYVLLQLREDFLENFDYLVKNPIVVDEPYHRSRFKARSVSLMARNKSTSSSWFKLSIFDNSRNISVVPVLLLYKVQSVLRMDNLLILL